MALGTLTKVAAYAIANRRVRVYDVQLTSGANYSTGGESITPAAVGLRGKIEQANALGLPTTSSGTTSRGVAFLYQASGAVKMLVQTTASAEAAGSSDQSTFTVRVEFVGY